MQTSTQLQATPAQAPPATPAVSITTIGANGKTQTLPIPATREQVDQLQTRKQQLSEELSDVSDRRHDLSTELQGTGDETARNGLRDRITLLDKRILQLETNLEATNNQLASAPPELIATTSTDAQSGSNDFEHGATLGGFSALAACAVVFALARRNMRQWRRRATSPLLESDAVQRLQRLENGMDAIAIEIERVSEGQRFVTKLLSESHPPLGASQQRGTVMSENPPKR